MKEGIGDMFPTLAIVWEPDFLGSIKLYLFGFLIIKDCSFLLISLAVMLHGQHFDMIATNFSST